MKTNFLKAVIFAALAIVVFSCSEEENNSVTETGSSTTVVNTTAKITVASATGVPKQNYIVMVFDQAFSTSAPLPPILKQVTTDAAGLATFDLKTIVTNTAPKFYYFEAFVETTSGFELKTLSRTKIEMVKGTSLTTALIVN